MRGKDFEPEGNFGFLVSHHEASMATLGADGQSAELTLSEVLVACGPVTIGTSAVVIESINWGEPAWWGAPPQLQWRRPLKLSITVDGELLEVQMSVPWLVDDRARTAAEHVSGLTLGSHWGMFLDRPIVPVSRIGYRPGIHVVHRAGPVGKRALILVPDVGPEARIWLRRADGTAVDLQVAGFRRRRVDFAFDDAAGETSASGYDAMDRLLGRSAPPLGVFAQATAANIARRLGKEGLAEVSVRGLARWLASLSADEITSRNGEMELTTSKHCGEVIRDAIAAGVFDGFARWAQSPESAAGLALAIRGGVSKNLGALTRGDGRFGSSLIHDDDRNTLALVERRRASSRYGYFIPRQRPRQKWLRDLSENDRFHLCPLQTPESTDIGFIRFRALGSTSPVVDGDLAEYADLSLAAGLVPFLNHNDPVRSSIGAKNLKQAVPIKGRSAPRVRTGVERFVAEAAGVARAPVAGIVASVAADRVRIEPVLDPPETVWFGPASPTPFKVDSSWVIRVAEGDRVAANEIVAHARDVEVADVDRDAEATLALGADVLVAYTPWFGLNYEDAVVVSDALIERFTSVHHVRFSENLAEDTETCELVVEIGATVEAGEVLAFVYRVGADEPVRIVFAPDSGTVAKFTLAEGGADFDLLVDRPLAVGDKITNRHGAKGVISAVIASAEMPRLENGTPIEMLLNPVGVIRRNNVGQLLEAHVSLRDYLRGNEVTIASRRLADVASLADELVALGAPGGRLPLFFADGSPVPNRTDGVAGVVVGWQHIVKLDHLAFEKVRGRGLGQRSTRDRQPAKGTVFVGGDKVAGAQRTGEMELWGLLASNANKVVEDIIEFRSGTPANPSPTLAAVVALLASAGIVFDPVDRSARLAGEMTTEPLPDAAVAAIVGPKRYGASLNRSEHPLYRDDIFGASDSPRCRCGQTTYSGSRCSVCGTIARPQDSAEQSLPRFHITLPFGVRHPWFKADDAAGEAPSIEVIPILPPSYRAFDLDPLNRRYEELIRLVERFDQSPDSRQKIVASVRSIVGGPNDAPETETIAARLTNKTGLARRGLRGRNNDWSGRAVIVPDPSLEPYTVALPPQLFDGLALDGDSDKTVIVNRQPSLLPHSLTALWAVRGSADAIGLHPLLTKWFAGDFDGDEVTVHRPVSSAARAEAKARLSPIVRRRHAGTGAPIAEFDLDLALGAVLSNKGEDLGVVLDRAASTEDGTRALTELAAVSAELFGAAVGWSYSLVELAGLESVDSISSGSSLGQARTAGIAGSEGGLRQLLERRGSLRVFSDEQHAPVASSFLGGLSNEEIFTTASGSLATLADKKVVTPRAGNLTKQLAEAMFDVVISAEDCGLGDDERSGPLGCVAEAGCCVLCYGRNPSTGGLASAGDNVGLLAALVIGERCTQRAMKAFQQGGTNVAVVDHVRELGSVFGQSGSSQSHFARCFDPSPSGAGELRPLVERAQDLLGSEVASAHIELVLRQAHRVARRHGPKRLLTTGARTTDPLIDASTRGRLEPIIDAVGKPPLEGEPPQLAAANRDWIVYGTSKFGSAQTATVEERNG